MSNLITLTNPKYSVSSVLNRDHKMYGKKHLFDNSEETCWNSDQGKPQWISINFGRNVYIKNINIMFQGGFVGQSCSFKKIKDKQVIDSFPFYPSDINYIQEFLVNQCFSSLRIEFQDSTDFFGRITIYKLEIIGNIQDE